MTRATSSKARSSAPLGILAAAAIVLGCVSPPPPIAPIDVVPLEAQDGEVVWVDQTVLVLDASGSMEPDSQFESTQNLALSFVDGMPNEVYQAGVVIFGGDGIEVLPPAAFDRNRFRGSISGARRKSKSSDIAAAIKEAAMLLEGRAGNSVVVIFSDGIASQYGRKLGSVSSLKTATRLVEQASGDVCFVAIQSGADPSGSHLMRALSEVTSCSQHRDADRLRNASSLYALQRDVFLEVATPAKLTQPVAMTLVDTDGDEVDDAVDQCLDTPRMAHVNEFGCWVLDSFAFESNKAEIREAQYAALDRVARVLELNPGQRIRIDGHTDASGKADFNQLLSRKRALAVREYLEATGIESNRLEAKGFGMSAPVASNATPEGRAQNRRCQMTVLK